MVFLDNGTFVVTSDMFFNGTLNFSQVFVVPVDTLGYNGSSMSLSVFSPVPLFSVWDLGNNTIEFDAGGSFDIDGNITSVFWDLGDVIHQVMFCLAISMGLRVCMVFL
jgi:hypothetical protein